MELIPAGEFMMGSPDGKGEDNERPQHPVELDAFFMDKYEVTNEEFCKFLNKKGSHSEGEHVWLDMFDNNCRIEKQDSTYVPKSAYGTHPVTLVSWYGAKAFAEWSSKRLPTEAEWEYACRAGTTTNYCFDDERKLGEYAWYDDNSDDETHLVGQKKPNHWGLYDMHGNVWEWCSDWYGGYSQSAVKDPEGPSTGTSRVLRGGSWSESFSSALRSANRASDNPNSRYYSDGFRCVRDLDSP